MRHRRSMSPADFRATQNGWGHPGWEKPIPVADLEKPARATWDEDSAIVVVPEAGKYRVQWDIGTSRFTLIPVELDF